MRVDLPYLLANKENTEKVKAKCLRRDPTENALVALKVQSQQSFLFVIEKLSRMFDTEAHSSISSSKFGSLNSNFGSLDKV